MRDRITTDNVKQERIKQSDRNRWYTVYKWTGPRDEVFIKVGEYLGSATCTPYYGHMLPRITKITLLDDNTIEVMTSQSSYAGD